MEKVPMCHVRINDVIRTLSLLLWTSQPRPEVLNRLVFPTTMARTGAQVFAHQSCLNQAGRQQISSSITLHCRFHHIHSVFIRVLTGSPLLVAPGTYYQSAILRRSFTHRCAKTSVLCKPIYLSSHKEVPHNLMLIDM